MFGGGRGVVVVVRSVCGRCDCVGLWVFVVIGLFVADVSGVDRELDAGILSVCGFVNVVVVTGISDGVVVVIRVYVSDFSGMDGGFDAGILSVCGFLDVVVVEFAWKLTS